MAYCRCGRTRLVNNIFKALWSKYSNVLITPMVALFIKRRVYCLVNTQVFLIVCFSYHITISGQFMLKPFYIRITSSHCFTFIRMKFQRPLFRPFIHKINIFLYIISLPAYLFHEISLCRLQTKMCHCHSMWMTVIHLCIGRKVWVPVQILEVFHYLRFFV